MGKAQRGYVKRYLAYNIKERAGSIAIVLCFIISFAAGMFLPELLSPESETLLFNLCYMSPAQQNFAQLFTTAFLSMAAFVLFWFLCGFHAFGQIFSIAAVILQALGFGVMASCMYAVSSGVVNVYYLLVLVPRMLIWLFVAILAVKQSFLMSAGFLSVVFPQIKTQLLATHFYLVRFALIFIISVVYGVLDALLQCLYTALM